MKITIELTAGEAAALYRLCDKISHSHAKAYLYPHISDTIRSSQAYDMMDATETVRRELAKANVNAFPWIDTGEAT